MILPLHHYILGWHINFMKMALPLSVHGKILATVRLVGLVLPHLYIRANFVYIVNGLLYLHKFI